MCGIVGSTKKNNLNISTALSSIAHRGPDGQQVCKKESVTLGHCRLSIIDLGEGGTQPMVSKNGRHTIVFNGEIYNYKSLRSALEKKGVVFQTQSDTEVLLEGYSLEGISFLSRMRGMWAFSIYDQTKETVVLCRDQFGIKPLYYSIQNGMLHFASEMKAFKLFSLSLTPNTNSYYTFFNLGYFISPDTCYKEVLSVEPGSVVTFSIEHATIKYEQITREISQVPKYSGTLLEGLHKTLLESVDSHFVADVPVGILFSGGNDSSLIAALSLASGHTPRAYHLAVEGSTDTEYAKKISAHLGIEAECISMSSVDLVSQYEKIWDSLDVPFADISIIPTSLIYSKISKETKVVLSGEGGDEHFGGYVRHATLLRAQRMMKTNLLSRLLSSSFTSTMPALSKINPLLSRIRNISVDTLSRDVIGMYLKETKIIDYPMSEQKMRDELFRIGQAHTGTPLGLLFDQQIYLSNDLLYKNDLASMMSSIEARVPFVDTCVQSYIARHIPTHMQLSETYNDKKLLKQILEKYLPSDLVYRDKKGFGFSFERYHVPSFLHDVQTALQFHAQHAEAFGVTADVSLFNPKHAEIFIKKYPRFAFGLVSNHKIFKK